MGVRNEVDHVPAQFTAAVEQIRLAVLRPEVELDEMPAPRRIAPYAHAVGGELVTGGEEVASGRFILLHDPAGNDAWGGTFRCVTFARAEVETDMAADPVLPGVGWSWLEEALATRGATFTAASGSVTVVHSEAFGELSENGSDAQIEVRASWTPTSGVGDHLGAWTDLMGSLAGLPPLAPGVVPMPRRSARSRSLP